MVTVDLLSNPMQSVEDEVFAFPETEPEPQPQFVKSGEGPVDALVVAAGSGRRMGDALLGRNKVLVPLAGKPLVLYSLETLLNSGLVRRLVLVYRAEDKTEISEMLQSAGLKEQIDMVPGGEARFDSVWNGLQALAQLSSGRPEIVVIHDAARPFVTKRMIQESVEQARKHGGATVAIPLTDTLKRGSGEFLHETLPRDELYRIQTPQTFRYNLLRQAHKEFREAPDPAVTDDCMLLERRGYPIALVLGEEINLKVTTPVDFHIAEAILQSLQRQASAAKISTLKTAPILPPPHTPVSPAKASIPEANTQSLDIPPSGRPANIFESINLSWLAQHTRQEKSQGPPPRHSLSQQVKSIIERAMKFASVFGGTLVSTEHLLLGLLDEPDTRAEALLVKMGVPLKKLHEKTHQCMQLAEHSGTDSAAHFSPAGVAAIQLGSEEMRNYGKEAMDTRHLLLGLLLASEGKAARLLLDEGVTLARLRLEIARFKESEGPPSTPP